MKIRILCLVICALCAGAAFSCSANKSASTMSFVASGQPKTPITQEVALATFDEIWSTVEQSDVERDHGGVDWVAVKVELRPKAMNATSREELRLILQDMLSRLKRSHFGIIPAESSAALAREEGEVTPAEMKSDGLEKKSAGAAEVLEKFSAAASENEIEAPHKPQEPLATKQSLTKSNRAAEAEASFGLTLRLIEKLPTVTGVRANSPADKAGVQMGWIVTSVDGVDMTTAQPDTTTGTAKYVQELILQGADAGDVESQETWIFQGEANELHTTTFSRERSAGISTKLGLLPPFQVRCQESVLSKPQLRALDLPDDFDIVVIGFNIWMPAIAQKVDETFQRHLSADGIIIDLRGNPGGAGGMAMGVAGHVMDQPKSLGTMRTRDTTLEFKVNPRRSTPQGERVEPFSGPVAIIMDPLSASTSEIFAGGLQKLDRARVFGRISAGAALPAQTKSLASGDALLFAFANFTLPDGSTIEGVGVLPDQITGTCRDDWTPNQDADINAAARWIASQYEEKLR